MPEMKKSFKNFASRKGRIFMCGLGAGQVMSMLNFAKKVNNDKDPLVSVVPDRVARFLLVKHTKI
jgi:hypothetical protein